MPHYTTSHRLKWHHVTWHDWLVMYQNTWCYVIGTNRMAWLGSVPKTQTLRLLLHAPHSPLIAQQVKTLTYPTTSSSTPFSSLLPHSPLFYLIILSSGQTCACGCYVEQTTHHCARWAYQLPGQRGTRCTHTGHQGVPWRCSYHIAQLRYTLCNCIHNPTSSLLFQLLQCFTYIISSSYPSTPVLYLFCFCRVHWCTMHWELDCQRG